MTRSSGRQVKRRHHTVARFYLQRFANDRGQLVRVELPGVRRHRISVNDATVQRDFYLAELEDGSVSDVAEDLLSELEGQAAPAIRELVDNRTWPVPDDARVAISGWAAAQHLRSPAVRRAGDDIADALLKLQIAVGGKPQLRRILEERAGEPVSDAEVDAAWAIHTDFDSYKVRAHPNRHLRMMGELLPGTTAMFFDRGWSIIQFERKALTTCDTPVVLVPARDHPPGMGIGLVNAKQILIPLDRRAALVMDELGAPDSQRLGTTKLARQLNRWFVENARRYMFHHPDDDPLYGLELPAPRDQEMDVGDQVQQFVRTDGWQPPRHVD
jgi:hypothetical protein